MNRTRVLIFACLLALVTSGCSTEDTPVATVEGVAITPQALAALHPAGSTIDGEQRASNLFLLILHRLLLQSAEEDFGFSVPPDARRKAFAQRTAGLATDLDSALETRGLTRRRVQLEADLDVVRGELELRLVKRGGPAVDMDRAYRSFLTSNSHVCLSALRVRQSFVAAARALVRDGADVEGVAKAFPKGAQRLPDKCASPAQFAPGLSSLAVDGNVAATTMVPSDGSWFVAAVQRREAPKVDSVRDEVLEIARKTQGPDVFNAWAADILRSADVEVAASIGRWASEDGTNGIPTVVAEPSD